MLTIDNLHVRVAGKDILKGISLDVTAGEVHAIMGPNGAGTATLGNVIPGRRGPRGPPSLPPCPTRTAFGRGGGTPAAPRSRLARRRRGSATGSWRGVGLA